MTVNGTNAANAINYSEGYNNLTNFLAGTLSPTWGQVSVDSYEPMEFIHKTILTINGLAGSDQINLNNLNTPTGLTSIMVNGGVTTTGDTLIVNGTTGVDAIGFSPTGAESGDVTVNSLPTVIFAAIENVIVNGQGGGDALTVITPAGTQDVTVTPGALADEGQVTLRNSTGAGNPLAGLSFTDIGASGSLTIAEASGSPLDNLTVVGTDGSNLFNVTAAGAIDLSTFTSPSGSLLPALVPVFGPGVSVLNLQRMGGNNVFDAAGGIPFTGGIYVDGGASWDGNTLNLTAATGPVTVNLADSTLSTNTTITGYGATVTLSGIDVANLNANSKTVSVVGTSQNDNITYTPTGASAGSFQDSGLNTVFNVSSVSGNLTVFGGSGGNADQVIVQGTEARDLFEINQGTAVATVLANNVTALLPVQLGTNVPILTVDGLGGENTFQVIPAAGIGAFPLDNLLINLDGGGSGQSNALVIAGTFGNTPAVLPATDFVVVNKNATPNSGTVRVYQSAVADPDINYVNVQTIVPYAAGTTATGGAGLNPNLLVMGPDLYEPNNDQGDATFLGSGATIQIQNATIFPNSSEFPGSPADQDFYQVVAQTTGTLDFQVYFKVYSTALLPAGGALTAQVLDAAGDVVGDASVGPTDFGALGTTANARVRIPAVAGQSYYLRVYGTTAAVVNGYNATIIDTAPPVPAEIELARSVLAATVTSGGAGYLTAPTVTITGAGGTGTGAIGTAVIANGAVTAITISEGTGYVAPPTITLTGGGYTTPATATVAITDTGDLPANTPNDDSGRSQFDNVTNVNTPTIFVRLEDAGFLQDIPGNQTAGGVPPTALDSHPLRQLDSTRRPGLPGHAHGRLSRRLVRRW